MNGPNHINHNFSQIGRESSRRFPPFFMNETDYCSLILYTYDYDTISSLPEHRGRNVAHPALYAGQGKSAQEPHPLRPHGGTSGRELGLRLFPLRRRQIERSGLRGTRLVFRQRRAPVHPKPCTPCGGQRRLRTGHPLPARGPRHGRDFLRPRPAGSHQPAPPADTRIARQSLHRRLPAGNRLDGHPALPASRSQLHLRGGRRADVFLREAGARFSASDCHTLWRRRNLVRRLWDDDEPPRR